MKVRPMHLLFTLMYGRAWVPRSIQIAARQRHAARMLSISRHAWPIDARAGSVPHGWPGWPAGKQFAFVLTHDVDTQRGLERCRLLMDLEEKLGFRSAFYFVPRGRYTVPAELLAEVKARGFEVGVHGLYHDWWTFTFRRVFDRRAPLIRQYMKEWGAVGFRAPSTVRNMDWIGELGVLYDTSASDTDPFEPSPHREGTIFPFRVPGNGTHRGYLEMPYTLAQDFTVFVMLQQKDPSFWQQKIDWIAGRGGLALLDVHPDYGCPAGSIPRCDEYPLSQYESFLRYVRDRHAGSYWHGLPCELTGELSRLQTPQEPPRTSPVQLSSGAPQVKQRIWIDLDNTPHVPFFQPVIRELERRGYSLVVTARDAFQVVDLAARMNVNCKVIGRHYGKHKLIKGAGLCVRALQLAPLIQRVKPDLAISHGSRSQLILSTLMGIPSVLIADYEHAGGVPLAHPRWLIAPTCIPQESIHWGPDRTLRYPGIKEDVYVPDFRPDGNIYRELGIDPSSILVTVRPPATEAHYHNPESEVLFFATMTLLCRTPNTRIVLLPRNKKQDAWIRREFPDGFRDGRICVPDHAIEGLNLLWHSDLVVSGGGTMNREAAALGVPVYSIFRGKMGAVDCHLAETGRLILLKSAEDVFARIRVEKRPQHGGQVTASNETLLALVDNIESIARAERSRR